MKQLLEIICLGENDSLRDAISQMDQGKEGIVLIINPSRKLLGTITDGDVRRWMLSNNSLDVSCGIIMNKNPIVGFEREGKPEWGKKLNDFRIRTIPIVDEENVVIDLCCIREITNQQPDSPIAVIMAGGEGRRLHPITEKLPKAMIKIGDKPLLEEIIIQLKLYGVEEIFLAVNYQADIIESYFEDGKKFGIKIKYLREEIKLGTAGALSLLPYTPDEHFFVINGDVVCDINFSQFLNFHKNHRSGLTAAASEYHIQIPYGVLDLSGHIIKDVKEKPTQTLFCNAGLYVVDPEVLPLIPKCEYYDMPSLMNDVLKEGLPVSAFPIHEHWIDIGNKIDLKRAKKEKKNSEL